MRHLIQINDMFRLRSSPAHWGPLWWLEEWEPGDSVEGRWFPASKRLHTWDMDRLLEQMQCPKEAREAFRATL